MRDPTVDYWADPRVERSRRLIAFTFGAAAGGALTAFIAALAGWWSTCPPSF